MLDCCCEKLCLEKGVWIFNGDIESVYFGIMNEFDIINEIFVLFFKWVFGVFGFIDDVVLMLVFYGCELVVMKDVLVVGVYFFFGDLLDFIVWKVLCVNFFDLVVKGVVLIGYVLVLIFFLLCYCEWFEMFVFGLVVD